MPYTNGKNSRMRKIRSGASPSTAGPSNRSATPPYTADVRMLSPQEPPSSQNATRRGFPAGCAMAIAIPMRRVPMSAAAIPGSGPHRLSLAGPRAVYRTNATMGVMRVSAKSEAHARMRLLGGPPAACGWVGAPGWPPEAGGPAWAGASGPPAPSTPAFTACGW